MLTNHFSLQIAKLVGVSSETCWSQVHAFTPQDLEKKAEFGSLTAVFGLKAKQEGLEMTSFGSEIIQRFHETYYESPGPVLEKLRLSLEKIKNEFSEQVDIYLAAAVVIDTEKPVIYLIVHQGKIKLYRSFRLATVLTADQQTKTASGYLQEQDKIIFGTAPFFSQIADDSLASVLVKENWEIIKEDLGAMIGARDDNSLSGAAIIGLALPPAPAVAPKKNLSQIITSLKHRLPQEKKWHLAAAVILIAILIGSLVLGLKKKSVNYQTEQEKAVLQSAQEKYEQGLSLVAVSPAKANELFGEAKKVLENFSQSPGSKTTDLRKKIEEALQKNTKEHTVTANLFSELKLIKDGFSGEDWNLNEKEVTILDPQQNTVLNVNLETKEGKISAGGDKIKGSTLIAGTGNNFYVLSKEKIKAIAQDGKILSERETKDLGEIKDIFGFSGNAYLLGKEQIYKFSGGSVLTQSNYLSQPVAELADSMAMAIDGSVWVLTKNGDILKYTRGVKDFFAIQGLDKPFSEPVAFFTSKDCENLYVLDRKNTRVVVFNKKGEYLASYLWPGVAGATKLAVLEDLKKIFLLTGSRIYEIEMK